mmetsp:Transcript_26379/g.71268  ORF Transcript_26379/g.71268 Transcript_26379/m.71268 type:complete len:237 (+) Transcript_26379:280-990(+)
MAISAGGAGRSEALHVWARTARGASSSQAAALGEDILAAGARISHLLELREQRCVDRLEPPNERIVAPEARVQRCPLVRNACELNLEPRACAQLMSQLLVDPEPLRFGSRQQSGRGPQGGQGRDVIHGTHNGVVRLFRNFRAPANGLVVTLRLLTLVACGRLARPWSGRGDARGGGGLRHHGRELVLDLRELVRLHAALRELSTKSVHDRTLACRLGLQFEVVLADALKLHGRHGL